ncbi:hypothetical protein [Aeromonas veronii]|uniref:hypothetical protein n=1 Tax=Aeromonas TaxID=642 RepID=UPI00225AF652|nr:hypothetical protein [Aeromonas veronii]MCX4047121.1 hypothetical protein [Aeromonas veronii]HDN9008289.1 hypothetical protein [Aeromonas veronii]
MLLDARKFLCKKISIKIAQIYCALFFKGGCMKLNKLALLLLIQPVIYGCSDDEQLDCNADSNKDTALHIIHRALTNTYNNPKIETVFNDERIENIKTRSVDAVGSLTCGATYSF